MTNLLPPGELQFCDENGDPYAAGTVGFYVPATMTRKATYQDAANTILNANPLTLDSAGRCIAWGSGQYQMEIHDSAGNLVYSRVTSAALPESAVSPFMLGVLGATSSLVAMQDLGVISYVQNAIANITLMPGPAGPVGAASTVPGPQGPQGPAGNTSASSFSNNDPGYWKDQSSGYTVQWATIAGNGSGTATFNYPIALVRTPVVMVTLVAHPQGRNSTICTSGTPGTTNCSAFIEDTNNSGGMSGATVQFLVVGFS